MDGSGCTPLMMAANRNNLPLVRYLLSQGANINAQRVDAHNRQTVLMQAQDIPMVQFLLEQGADPAIPNASGENAYEDRLRHTHRPNHLEIAALLKQHLK
jgi:ankyrin repeat protein